MEMKSNKGRPWRRLAAATIMWVAFGLACLITLMINFIAGRHVMRFDFTRSNYAPLSAQTLNVLARADRDLRITAFLSAQNELFPEIRSLLRGYAAASARVTVEFIDPHRDPARSKALVLRHDLREPNVLIVESGERRVVLPVASLADEHAAPCDGERLKIPQTFRGEHALAAAVQRVLYPGRPVVYFLTGHGERQIDNFDPYTGYSVVARIIEQNNMEARSLSFDGLNAVPGDTGVLVIAGPTKHLAHTELEMIGAYLNNYGRLLLLLDAGPETGLEKMLEYWGVRVDNDRVIGSPSGGRQLLVSGYGGHPVSDGLQNITTVFTMPRSVQPLVSTNPAALAPADKPRVSVLAATTGQGWAERSVSQNPPVFDPGVDQPGPIPVAVAVEKGPMPGIEMALKPTRMIVVGDSLLVSNGALLSGGNADFFISALNWLLEREPAMVIAAHQPAAISVALDRTAWRKLAWIVAGGLPGLTALIGLLVWRRRR